MSNNHDREQGGSAGNDTDVVRAWRQASDEQPQARLDAAILGAARRSIEMKDESATTRGVRARTRRRWMQWQPLAAAATVAGLAFVLVQTMPREHEVAPPIRMQAPGPAASPELEAAAPAQGDAPVGEPTPAPAPAISLESQSRAPAPVITEAPAEVDAGPPLRERGAAGVAGSPSAEASPDVADVMRSVDTDQRKGVMTDAAGEAYSQEAAAPAAGHSAIPAPSTAAARSAADWATWIEALHASGDLAAAAAALREFRAVDPDADSYLPESLRDWARTVR